MIRAAGLLPVQGTLDRQTDLSSVTGLAERLGVSKKEKEEAAARGADTTMQASAAVLNEAAEMDGPVSRVFFMPHCDMHLYGRVVAHLLTLEGGDFSCFPSSVIIGNDWRNYQLCQVGQKWSQASSQPGRHKQQGNA
eukprot:GHVU01086181.1.p2 GENE.GHVU01086181.1~~GHVU01086181.1.p2  ORF type:complete len:137 (+),score=25.63 GHVU01086181.1:241-651(+)